MNSKQEALVRLAQENGVTILNAEEYKNRDSIIKCKCNALGHIFEDTVTDMMRSNFQCFECFKYDAQHVKDRTPYFLALDAASYTTGMSIFNRDGQLLGHKAFVIEKKKDFFTRVKELRDEIVRIVKQDNIKCVILEEAKLIFDEDISEDESESIFLGYYGIYVYNQQQQQEED